MNKNPGVFHRRYSTSIITGIILGFSFLHPTRGTAQSPDTLNVSINKIALDSTSIRGKIAAFPYPILTFISVSGSNSNHVTGLADTSQWLAADEIAPNGKRISDNFRSALERHQTGQGEKIINLFDQRPAPLFREVTETSIPIIPTSTMLLLDESSSIQPSELELAKQGARTFVRGMRPEDRAGIIRFSDETKTLNFTSDTTALNNFIDASSTVFGTPLYQSISDAIDLTIAEPTLRRSIIVFTDGMNSRDTQITPNDLIAKANAANIVIHTVGLGEEIDVAVLTLISRSTGGQYRFTLSGVEFPRIFREFSEIIKNFYIMAYIAPTPCEYGDVRTVDITVTDAGRTGKARAQYQYQGVTPDYDLQLSMGSTPLVVDAGNDLQFSLELSNAGINTAYDIAVIDTLPTGVSLFSASPQPDSSRGNMLFWYVDSLAPGMSGMVIKINVAVNPILKNDVISLTNVAGISASCDNDASNNVASKTVMVNKYADIFLTTNVKTDSFIVTGTDTTWYAQEQETYAYSINVGNKDSVDAANVVLKTVLPSYISGANRSAGDTLTWNLGTLSSLSDTTIAVDVTVAANVPADSLALVHQSFVIASNELPANVTDNTVIDTVYVIGQAPPEPVVLQIGQAVRTDSFSVQNSDKVWYAREDETITYVLVVRNTSNTAALNTTLYDIIADSMNGLNFNAGDTVRWNLGTLAAQSDTTIRFDATVVPHIPFNAFPLVNTAFVRAANLPSGQPEIMSVDTAFAIIDQNELLTDISIFQTIRSDSFIVNGPDTSWYVYQGKTYSLINRIENKSVVTAQNVVLRTLLPDWIGGVNFSTADTLQWNLGNLAASHDTTITVAITVADSVPRANATLIHKSFVTAINEQPNKLADNSAIDTMVVIYGKPPITPTAVVLHITQSVKTDSFVIQNTDSVWLAREAETVTYTLRVSNTGDMAALNTVLFDIIPDSMNGPTFTAGDTINWPLGTIAAQSDTTIQFAATVVPHIPLAGFPFINTAFVHANNLPAGFPEIISIDTAFAIVTPSGTLSDISAFQKVMSDSFRVDAGDTTWYVAANERYSYELIVHNESGITASNVEVSDFYPVLTQSVANSIQPASGLVTDDSIYWDIGDMTPFGTTVLSFDVIAPMSIQAGSNEFINNATVKASNEDPAKLANNMATSSAYFYLPQQAFREACDLFTLDVNVFEPDRGIPLGINFELETAHAIKVDVLDLSGYRIKTLFNESFNAGINRREWDGAADNGKLTGSGVYIITLQSADKKLECWKKVIIRR
ncbi:DUF11 domain-containing protein [candidate division KSB1 bacterium]|nr:DUF11 domain-containing protein [candidate division KSB1 bacterium]